MTRLVSLLALLILAGCTSTRSISSSVGNHIADITSVGDATSSLSVLSLVGGLSTAGGIVLLAVTGGRRGWYPAIGGVALCLLNWAVMTYAHAIFIPVLVATGVITVAWTYRLVRQILREKGNKKCSQISPRLWGRRGS
jgi:hypothetical protein